jgi:hypothetical protein
MEITKKMRARLTAIKSEYGGHRTGKTMRLEAHAASIGLSESQYIIDDDIAPDGSRRETLYRISPRPKNRTPRIQGGKN